MASFTRDVFDQAVAHVRTLSPATFDQWFGGVQFDGLSAEVLSLRGRNEFVVEWVSTNFIPALVAKLRELSGWAVEVAWTVDADLAEPIGTMPTALPVRPRPLDVRLAPVPASDPAIDGEAMWAPLEALPLPAGVSAQNTFGSFVVGPSNQLAHAAALAAAGGGGRRGNPLFICGGTGLGKTHLMHAIAHRVREERPRARIVCVSGEAFTNDFVSAIQSRTMGAMRTRYREACDVLLLDDVQFLAGREQTQEELFHTFNALHAAGRPIVLTSDVPPKGLQKMAERLVSRFAWGLVADMQAPELETRIAILRRRAADDGIDLGDDVALFLAHSLPANVRELEGALVRLGAKSSLLGVPVDLAFARAELAAVGTSAAPAVTSIEAVQRAVCHHFELRAAELAGPARGKALAFARHVAMYLCRERLRVSYQEIGKAFGNRDHSTVTSAVRKVAAGRAGDATVRAHLAAVERRLEAAA